MHTGSLNIKHNTPTNTGNGKIILMSLNNLKTMLINGTKEGIHNLEFEMGNGFALGLEPS